MFSVRFSDTYEAEQGEARSGTIALYFSAAGAFELVMSSGEEVAGTAVAGTQIEFGPIAEFATLPEGTLGMLGR